MSDLDIIHEEENRETCARIRSLSQGLFFMLEEFVFPLPDTEIGLALKSIPVSINSQIDWLTDMLSEEGDLSRLKKLEITKTLFNILRLSENFEVISAHLKISSNQKKAELARAGARSKTQSRDDEITRLAIEAWTKKPRARQGFTPMAETILGGVNAWIKKSNKDPAGEETEDATPSPAGVTLPREPPPRLEEMTPDSLRQVLKKDVRKWKPE